MITVQQEEEKKEQKVLELAM